MWAKGPHRDEKHRTWRTPQQESNNPHGDRAAHMPYSDGPHEDRKGAHGPFVFSVSVKRRTTQELTAGVRRGLMSPPPAFTTAARACSPWLPRSAFKTNALSVLRRGVGKRPAWGRKAPHVADPAARIKQPTWR